MTKKNQKSALTHSAGHGQGLHGSSGGLLQGRQMLVEIKCIDGVSTSCHLCCSRRSRVSVPLKAVQADGAFFRGETVVLRRMGRLCEALLAPQFRRAVVVWNGLLEPRFIERVALHG